MTREEWLKIGFENGLIDLEESEKILFCDAYAEWIKSKCKVNRPSTMDRIEVTWNRYFANSSYIDKCTSSITEKDIIAFLNTCIVSSGSVSQKELERIYQILHSVLVYTRDMEYKGSRLYDWDVVKRNIPYNKVLTQQKNESALSKTIVNTILQKVISEDIYPQKRSACLCLCLNFYLGLRIGELAALQFSNFDLERRVVTITHSDTKTYERDSDGNKLALAYKTAETKTISSIREIPLVPESIYILGLIGANHKVHGYNCSYLCYDGTDTIRIRSLDRTLRRLCVLCGVTHFNTHRIRKTFASMLHHSNVPTRVISDLMGHSEISTTEKNYILSFKDTYSMYYSFMKDSLNYN